MDRPEDRRALIEVLGPDGRVQRTVDVLRWPLSLGRALHNTVVLDDPHVAASHALVDVDGEGRPRLVVGSTRNGLQLDGQWLQAGEQVALDDAQAAELQLGVTRLRLRLPREALAPERALSPHLLHQSPPRFASLLGLALLLLGWLLGEQWLLLDPGAEFTEWLPGAVGVPAALLGWVLAWATASKLFRHRFEFLPHALIALRYGLALAVLDGGLPQLAGALSWPWLSHVNVWVQVAGVALWMRSHARQVLPHAERPFTLATAGAALAVMAVMLTLNLRANDRWHGPAYLSVLPPPALRFGAVESPEQLVARSETLRAGLDARVRRAQREDDADQGADDDEEEEGGAGE